MTCDCHLFMATYSQLCHWWTIQKVQYVPVAVVTHWMTVVIGVQVSFWCSTSKTLASNRKV